MSVMIKDVVEIFSNFGAVGEVDSETNLIELADNNIYTLGRLLVHIEEKLEKEFNIGDFDINHIKTISSINLYQYTSQSLRV